MLRWIAGLLAFVVLAGAYFTYSQHTDLLEARGALKRVAAKGETLHAGHILVSRFAEQAVARADSLEEVAQAEAARAARAELKLAAAPTVRDSLGHAVVAKDAYRSAFHSQVKVSGELRVRGDSLARDADRLAGIVRDYGDASKAVLKASNPSFLQRLIPKVGVGVTAGISPITRRADVIIGPSLNWNF